MNAVLNTLTQHRSIRRYTDEPVSDAHLNAIAQAAMAAPSSVNGQQVTIVCVQDAAKKQRIAEIAGGQPWVAQAPVFLLFCMDFQRAEVAMALHGETLAIHNSIEAQLVGACDVGLMMGNAIAAAESLGLGIVPIGGIRRDPLALVELLALPQLVFPLCGLTVGHPASSSECKPRLPQNVVFHRESYQPVETADIEEYDRLLSAHMTRVTHGKLTQGWSDSLCSYYRQNYAPEVRPALLRQGFGLDE